MNERQTKLTEVVGTLCLTFGREFDPRLVEIWDKALADIPIDQIEKAAMIWVSGTGKRFPSPSDIRDLVQGSPDQKALDALEICIKHSRFDNSPEFANPAIAVAIERTAGGWESWCEWVRWMPEEQFQWKRKEWINQYKHAAQHGLRPTMKRFVGYREQLTMSSGPFYGPIETKLISNDGTVETKLLADPNMPTDIPTQEEVDQILKEEAKKRDS